MQTLFPLLIPLEGFWDTLMAPLTWAVSGLLVLAHNLFAPLFGSDSGLTWTLAILLLTIVIRSALIPLFVRQIRSSRNMQILQPKIRELQKKYAHDREKLGQETMKLYKDEGVNPMASCFPLILQMPIFFALFRVLNGAARNTPVGKFLVDRPDLVHSMTEAKFFGARLADTFLPLTNGFGLVQVVALIMILAMIATTFISQRQLMAKNMPPEAMTGPMAQQQKIMLYLFPLIFGIGGISFPVGLLIYWTASNLWTMAQQFYVIRNSPTPGTPAYAAWESRMIAKGYDRESLKPGQKPTRGGATSSGSTAADPDRPISGQVQESDGTPRIQRQQPRRQTRSNRKK